MTKKIVIIGGGVAGLSAGIYARLNGFETEIYEMHSTTGGQCTAWDRNGFRFDYCLHWLVGTRSGPFNDIWRETNVLNNDVKIIDHDISSVIKTDDGRDFIFYTNLDKWEKYLLTMAPEDEKSIKKMCGDMRKSVCLQPFTDPPGMRGMFKMMKTGIALLPITGLFLRFGKKRCTDYFKSLNFRNRDLKFFLDSLYGSRDFSALGFIMMFAWFNQKNTGYLIGGSRPMAQRMTQRFKELNGKLFTGKKVKNILVSDHISKGIVLSDGKEIYADYIISAADGHSTIFEMLGGKFVNRKILDAYQNWEVFAPMVQVSFGIGRVIESFTQTEVWLNKNQMIGSTEIKNGFSIMNYSFDPSMAPKGKTVILMRYDTNWELWKDLSPGEYKIEKQKIEADSKSIMEKQFPGISADIETIDIATPITSINYTGVWKGAYEGFLPSSRNMTKQIDPVLPGLNNFYMAGQWLFPGGGLPPAAQSGRWAIQYICKKEGIRFSH